jgi:hypothetical protein
MFYFSAFFFAFAVICAWWGVSSAFVFFSVLGIVCLVVGFELPPFYGD